MSRKTIQIIPENDYSVISLHYVEGRIAELPEYQRQIINRWEAADKILMKFPKKSVAARKLQAKFPEISIRQAQQDIDDACKFWNIHKKADKGFLYRFLVEHLTETLANQAVPYLVKAKYAAVMQKLHDSIEEESIDPKLMEKNTVNIQFNINNNNIIFSEKELNIIPLAIRQKLLALTQNTITETDAIEIMNS